MERHPRFLALAAAALIAGCAGRKPYSKSSGLNRDVKRASLAGLAEAAPAAPPVEVTEASLRFGGFDVRPDLKAVPFDYDSAQLSDEARTALKAHADVLKAEPALEVLVAGHCDERGTVAYNLALGQKRAKEARDYYIRLGVEGTRVATISYGNEQPLCRDSNDSCWSKNRRAQTLTRARTASAAPAARALPAVPTAPPSPAEAPPSDSPAEAPQ